MECPTPYKDGIIDEQTHARKPGVRAQAHFEQIPMLHDAKIHTESKGPYREIPSHPLGSKQASLRGLLGCHGVIAFVGDESFVCRAERPLAAAEECNPGKEEEISQPKRPVNQSWYYYGVDYEYSVEEGMMEQSNIMLGSCDDGIGNYRPILAMAPFPLVPNFTRTNRRYYAIAWVLEGGA